MGLLKLIIADDEKTARESLRRALSRKYLIIEAKDGQQAYNLIKKENPDMLLLDINMPKMGGFQVLEKISEIKNRPLCIIMTAYGSERVAVESLKKGAWDYIAKPFKLDEIRMLLKNASDMIRLKQENRKLKNTIIQSKSKLIGQSKEIEKVRKLINKVSTTDATTLITGESGTGKELAAQSIHNQSNRCDEPFIALNCGAIPKDLIESELFGYKKGAFTGAVINKKGKFQLAEGGTLFLDEIGNMNHDTQIKVLRAIEEKSVTPLGADHSINTNVRIIAATNSNLKKSITEKKFREDLYYRICVIEINLPKLTDHKDDIALLMQFFIDKYCNQYNKTTISPSKELIEHSKNYHWPGNVRELRNIIENAVILSGKQLDETIISKRLSNQLREQVMLKGRSFQKAKKELLEPIEISLIHEALGMAKNNITKAAEILGMKRQYLQQKIKQLKIKL